MMTLALQIFLLLLAGFLLGCITGCLLRRAFNRPIEVDARPATVIAPLATPAATAAGESPNRFERVLQGEVPAQTGAREPVVEIQRAPPVPPARPVTPPPPPPPPQAKPAAPPVPPPAPPVQAASAPTAAVVAPPAPAPMPSAPTYTEIATAAAAARQPAQVPQPPPTPFAAAPTQAPVIQVAAAQVPAAKREPSYTEAAIAATGGVVPKIVDPKPAPPQPSERLSQPARADANYIEIALAGGALAVATAAAAATVRPTVAAPVPRADDLTRIRAIDSDLEAKLNGAGISMFSDIAAWSASDVSRFSETLKLGGRVALENWIEQAQILARGGTTTYSQRQTGLSTAGVAAAPVARADDLTRIRAIDAPLRSRLNAIGITRFSDIAGWSASDVAKISQSLGFAGRIEQENWIEQAQILAKGGETHYSRRQTEAAEAEPAAPSPVPAPAPSKPSSAEAAAAAAAAIAAAAAVASKLAASGAGPDRLQRIIGIDGETESLLIAHGCTKFEHVASLTPEDVKGCEELMGQPGRIARENWIEQARVLARGGDAEQSRPVKLVDAIRAKAAPGRADLTGLRSVRSEALIGGQPAGGAARSQGPADDLKRVRGIGVLIEKKLNSLGITTYDQIANWVGADIDRMSQVLDFKGRIERENWVEQARILASGGQTDFSRRVDRGEVETSK